MSSLSCKNITHDILLLSGADVFVVGDLILDVYVEGQVTRVSPEAPVPIILETARHLVLGGAANVAANVTAMGAHAFLCGRVGEDQEGDSFLSRLSAAGLSAEFILRAQGWPTITKTRLVSRSGGSAGSQQILRVDRETKGEIAHAEERFVIEAYTAFLEKRDGLRALVLSDYGKGFLTRSLLQRLIHISQVHGIPVVTDPKSDDIARYAGSTVIKPNLGEARLVCDRIEKKQVEGSFLRQFDALAQCYLEASACENLVMSLSEHGVLGIGKKTSGFHFATQALQVADVSGAGDTLVAFLGMGLAAGFSLERATELGNFAAGIVCAKAGTATVSPSEFLEAFRQKNTSFPSEKRVFLQDLVKILKSFRKKQKKIVFTNGCFDLLHAGHISLLQQAKQQGDLLVVGLNSDASVARLKGSRRPLQPAEDRALLLAALECVSYVVVFDEDTPLETILALKPDVLVKGADYTTETVVGAEEVKSWGGDVRLVPLVPKRSTTAIVKAIEDSSQSSF